jgi:hypothetical protein
MTVKRPEAIDPAPTGVPLRLRNGVVLRAGTSVEGGRKRLFCLAMQRRRSRRRKIAAAGRCGKVIETQSSCGHTRLIEASVGAPQADADRCRPWLHAHRWSSMTRQRRPGRSNVPVIRPGPALSAPTAAARAHPLAPHLGRQRSRPPTRRAFFRRRRGLPPTQAAGPALRRIVRRPLAQVMASYAPRHRQQGAASPFHAPPQAEQGF